MEGWAPDTEGGFVALIGPTVTRVVDGVRQFGLVIGPQHLNRDGSLHGGMIAALFDHAIGIVASESSDAKRHVTIQLNTYFIGGGKSGDFVELRSEVTWQTRSLLFMRGSCICGERLLATADGIWKKMRK